MPPELSELDQLRLEHQKLENEDLRIKLAERKQRSESQRMTREQVQADLAAFLSRQETIQNACNHRKGGKDLNGLLGNGLSMNHSIIHHTLPFGEVMVMCMRCQKMWLPKTPGYRDALGLTTDNSHSTSTLFVTQDA